MIDKNGSGNKQPLREIVEQVATEAGLVTNCGKWLDKCMQIYDIARVSSGVILAGPSGVGKSKALRTLVDALISVALPNSGHAEAHLEMTTPDTLAGLAHRIQKLYPLVSDDCATIFGRLLHDGNWKDGVFNEILKKANRNESVTWLCLDGPLESVWTEYFAGILDKRKVFTFGNGDQLFIGPKVRVVFETDSVVSASPATITRMGVVYFDMEPTAWVPTATVWLASQTEMCQRVLEPAFQRTFEYVFQFLAEHKPVLQCTNELGLLASCLSLLGALLADNQSPTQDTHLERLFIFSVISSFGTVLAETDHKLFGDGLKNITGVLPDDDREISVFDYYVDETGEWDTWVTK